MGKMMGFGDILPAAPIPELKLLFQYVKSMLLGVIQVSVDIEKTPLLVTVQEKGGKMLIFRRVELGFSRRHRLVWVLRGVILSG
jgi:hypothetical protein